MPVQVGIATALLVAGRDADAGADLERQSGELDRPRKLVNDLARQALGSITAGLVAQGHAELVAAETRHGGAAGKLRQATRNHLQHFIAQPVAIHVVDRLEVVEIENEHRAGLARRQMLDRTVEILDEAAAVGQAGQYIVPRHLMGLGLRLATRDHLAVQVNGAANRVDLGGHAEEHKEDHEPVDGVALRFVGVDEEPVERVVPNRHQIERQADRAHDDQVPHHAALPRVPRAQIAQRLD